MFQSPLIGSNWESCDMPDIFQQVNTDYKSGPGSLGIKFPPESPVVCSRIRTRSSRGWGTPCYGVKRSSAHANKHCTSAENFSSTVCKRGGLAQKDAFERAHGQPQLAQCVDVPADRCRHINSSDGCSPYLELREGPRRPSRYFWGERLHCDFSPF